jgi:hypothetical protein
MDGPSRLMNGIAKRASSQCGGALEKRNPQRFAPCGFQKTDVQSGKDGAANR